MVGGGRMIHDGMVVWWDSAFPFLLILKVKGRGTEYRNRIRTFPEGEKTESENETGIYVEYTVPRTGSILSIPLYNVNCYCTQC